MRDLKERRYNDARAKITGGKRSRQTDLTATLLTAWTYAGSKDLQRALATVDRLKSERAFNQFREYHAALICRRGRQFSRGREALQGGL